MQSCISRGDYCRCMYMYRSNRCYVQHVNMSCRYCCQLIHVWLLNNTFNSTIDWSIYMCRFNLPGVVSSNALTMLDKSKTKTTHRCPLPHYTYYTCIFPSSRRICIGIDDIGRLATLVHCIHVCNRLSLGVTRVVCVVVVSHLAYPLARSAWLITSQSTTWIADRTILSYSEESKS